MRLPTIVLLPALGCVAVTSLDAQALTGAARTESLWRVQVATTTQLRPPGQPIGYPTPSWQLTVPHISGSLGASLVQFGTVEQFAVEERLQLTQGIRGSIGAHETLLTWTANRPVAFDLVLDASITASGTASGLAGHVEIDVGDDGSVELAAAPGEVRSLEIPISMGVGTLDVRVRTALYGQGAEPFGPTTLLAFGGVRARFAPASWQVVGHGCAGSNGVPALQPVGGQRPFAGEDFALALTGLPSGPVTGLLGFSRSNWGGLPLPLDLIVIGMPGCILYSDIVITLGIPSAGGVGTWTLPIPADASLLGDRFLQQLLCVDPTANPFGATTSNSGLGQIGSRNL